MCVCGGGRGAGETTMSIQTSVSLQLGAQGKSLSTHVCEHGFLKYCFRREQRKRQGERERGRGGVDTSTCL